MSSPAVQPLTWRELLEQQQGVLARWQALRSGLTEEAWTWRLRRGTWQLVLPGVAVAHAGRVSWPERAWAAVVALAGGRGEEPERVDVAVPAERQRASHGWARIHRCAALAELRHPVRSPPQLRLPPAVLHAARWSRTDREAEWRVAAVVQQRLVRVPDLRDALAKMPRLPRRALGASVLDDVELGAHARTELDFLAFLRRHRLPLPTTLGRPMRATGVRYLDAWWEAQRVAGELDGAHHREVGTWDADLLRANAVQVAERHDRFVLLRFTTGNLRHDEPEVAGQLRSVLV